MYNLTKLISEKGYPDALIDHHHKFSPNYAIYGFEEEFIINHNGISMVNDEELKGNPLINFQKTLDSWKKVGGNISAFGFISYDIKNLIYPNLNFKKIDSSFPLLWFGKPKKIFPYKIMGSEKIIKKCSLTLKDEFISFKNYEKKIKIIKDHLYKGNCYQINFTHPFYYKTDDDAFELYMNLRKKVKPLYGCFLNNKNYSILSFSPENFIKTNKNIIQSYPMKGTIKRSNNKIIDDQLLNKLKNSSKDKAENLMIVDLIRNDLGKICKNNSIKVDSLFKIESFPTVHQMTSKISGELKKDNIDEAKIIFSLFPGGSITGAPKQKSVEIIDCLENYNRGIYTGCMGYITNKGDINLNIAIRTLKIINQIGIYPVGGGIVWDSVAKNEWLEAIQKRKILSLLN
ncbi:MAG: hypothetical protein CMF98_02105 [Candidatus Marinimicrobia bacterium]|nr:hypothetical protein [Candidatus Neomarinimicrobiota bacterium]OUW50792.1 MAG: hypothetical protein CBD50_00700 [bacterium TMED190]|tara:strand:- start:40752 stop:41954 length:1203 start_codon:yes stop_codon:yes gene_type:complete